MTEETAIGFVQDANISVGETKGNKWKRSTIKIGDKIFSSFDEQLAKDILDEKITKGTPVEITYEVKGKYNNIKSIFSTDTETAQKAETIKPASKMTSVAQDDARGKVRHGVATAAIAHDGLVELTPEREAIMQSYTDWIMDGKIDRETETNEEQEM